LKLFLFHTDCTIGHMDKAKTRLIGLTQTDKDKKCY